MSRISRELQMTLQAAHSEAISRRHAYLTVEHLLYALIHSDEGLDILRHSGAQVEILAQDLERFFSDDLDKVPGDDPVDTLQTLAFHRVVQHAVDHAESAEKEEVDISDLLVALFQEPDSFAVNLLRAQEVARLDVTRYISHGESKLKSGEGGSGSDFERKLAEGMEDGELSEENPLEAFATNLTQRAADGRLDPMIGRAAELERAIHILARRRKNNPLFVGETGVGKTSIAEGLAARIHEGRVPEDLQGANIYSLDVGALLAGTRYRGDFEARFKGLLSALMEEDRAILFIDEIHTILGAGSAQGTTVDASNMLKPGLADGSLRCMGSTTYQEYRHFERDRALSRRFQKVDVPEPSEDECLRILKGLASRYEEHHGVRYTAAALKGCVELSARHINERFLPDKAIDVMDETGATVRLRPTSKRRKTVGIRDVELVVSSMTNVPLQRTATKENQKLSHLEDDLLREVFGQDDAVRSVATAIKRSRAGLGGLDRPIGSFLFVGPTGVGKTELSKQLAKSLNVPFLRFDMSEYMEKHAVSRLIGAPPGYVGYDQGGALIEQVRKNPYAVLLLDEIEKAHPDIFDILLQVMDHATLTDNQGREADFRHVTLIMTSNAGAREMAAQAIGFSGSRAGDGTREIEKLFSPEFRNRLDEIVRFSNLGEQVMVKVVGKFLIEMKSQLLERKIQIELTSAALDRLAEKGYDPDFGARPLARLIQREIKDPLSDEVLFGRLSKGGRVVVDAGNDGFVLEFPEAVAAQ
ncbi:MAG: ATP-dependent Clp protease ATP-binding subunit ClpA [Deltaproteobacteria bacterium]|nr:ATP-dependent Clp protease ATP-binding subunit ClpA [Deltaproteobacteria bacterium]